MCVGRRVDWFFGKQSPLFFRIERVVINGKLIITSDIIMVQVHSPQVAQCRKKEAKILFRPYPVVTHVPLCVCGEGQLGEP